MFLRPQLSDKIPNISSLHVQALAEEIFGLVFPNMYRYFYRKQVLLRSDALAKKFKNFLFIHAVLPSAGQRHLPFQWSC